MTKSIPCLFIPGAVRRITDDSFRPAIDKGWDDEIKNAPVNSMLAAMNQVPLRIGASEGRVTQVALIVTGI
jgi:hypothetical protein